MSEENKNSSSQPAGEKKFSLEEKELLFLYNLAYVVRDLVERQKICEIELFRFLSSAYARIEEEQKEKFRKYFGDRFKKE